MQSVAEKRTKVYFNPSLKSWEAANGQVQSFGTGPEAKRQALIYALGHDHPELFYHVASIAAMGGNDPKLVDTLLKAASLVCKGKVFAGRVGSQSSDRFYTVTFDGCPKSYACDCPHFQHGGIETDLGRACKHTLAQHLSYLIEGGE